MESKKPQSKTNTAQLKQDINRLKKECQTYLDGWQRERADFTNYKQHNEKYIEEVRSRTKQSVVFQLLVAVDNIDLVIQYTPKNIASTEWYKGVEQVHKQIQQSFHNLGLKEIDCTGQFDPSKHEAVDGQGEVIESVVQKGYTLDDVVIRPAKVKVTDNTNNT